MATRPLPEAAESRFAPYIEELHEFFATSGVPFGAAEDIPGIMERLREQGTFSKDLSSLVRSFMLRQGGAMPSAQLMEILSFAIAGPEMARSPQQYREALRELLTFVTGVVNRPWNVPPGERMEAEIVPFPDEYAVSATGIDPVPYMAAAAEIAAIQEVEAEPPPLPQSMPIPIEVHEPDAEAAAPTLISDEPPDTLSDPAILETPNPAPEAMPEAVAPMSAISAALAAESERLATPPEPILPIARVPEAEPALHSMLRPIPTGPPLPNDKSGEDEPRSSDVSRYILIAAVGGLLLAAVLVIADRVREGSTVPPAASPQTMGPAVNPITSPPSPQTPPAASSGAAQTDATGPAYPAKHSARRAPLRSAHAPAAGRGDPYIAEPYSSAPEYAPQHVFGKARPTTQPVTGSAHPTPLAPAQQQGQRTPASTSGTGPPGSGIH